MYAFLTLLGILVILFVIVKTTESKKEEPKEKSKDEKKEGFVGYVPLNTDSKAIIPETIAVAELPVGVKSSDLPGSLPTAPYQQIGANLPSPYKDPSLVKTTRQRILNVLESLKGFLAFQATEIEDRSDPTIQLPLNTARSDFQRLESEANVLQRNPGLTPQMTALDIAQIEDNLAYLQREVELIGSNRPFHGPQHDLDLEEGFDGDYTRAQETNKGPASVSDLAEFSLRIQKAIKDLSSSGTTDPIVQTRIGNLTAMKNQVDTMIKQINSGILAPEDVPIKSSDITKAIPQLGNAQSPLLPIMYTLIGAAASSAAITPDMITTLSRYAKQFLDNADGSLSFNVNYGGAPLQTMNLPIGDSTLTETGFPSPYDLNQVADAPSLNNIIGAATVTDRWAQDPRAEGRTPATGDARGNYTGTVNAATFDWKGRCKTIKGQVEKRGLKPEDYGFLPDNAKVSSDFSWKGHTKMVCSRLKANSMDKMDEMCGCPPITWKGWNA